jgi:predicted transglutaminase-like cysteine proteinase
MRLWLFAGVLSVIMFCAAQGSDVRDSHGGHPLHHSYTQMVTFGASTPILGFREFCARQPKDGNCVPRGETAPPVMLTAAKWQELETVNAEANRTIKPMSDQQQYGVLDYWTYPDSGFGDCEDYVLYKQRELRRLGWPASDLLITVVQDENHEGHAILTVRTTTGDLMLDNKHSRILSWDRTPYTYRMRQSAADPRRWDSLVPEDHDSTIATSGRHRGK